MTPGLMRVDSLRCKLYPWLWRPSNESAELGLLSEDSHLVAEFCGGSLGAGKAYTSARGSFFGGLAGTGRLSSDAGQTIGKDTTAYIDRDGNRGREEKSFVGRS